MSNSKKRRAKTKPKRLDVKKVVTGFVGERFIIQGGKVEPIQVAVIGTHAFQIFHASRYPYAKRASIVNRERLFATRDAAVRSMKPVLGWAVTHRNELKPVRIITHGDGERAAYDRKDEAHPAHGAVFEKKWDALECLRKRLVAELKEKSKEHATAARRLEVVLKQMPEQ